MKRICLQRFTNPDSLSRQSGEQTTNEFSIQYGSGYRVNNSIKEQIFDSKGVQKNKYFGWMKTPFLILSMLIAVQILYGQVSNYTNVYQYRKFFIDLEIPYFYPEIEIEGSPFFDSTFVDVSFLVGETEYLLPLRYNIFLEAFEAKLDNKSHYINSNLVDTVFYNNTPYLFKKEGTKQKVFQMLHRGEQVELLKKYTVLFIDGSSGVPFKEDVLPHFKNKMPDYYLYSEVTGLNRIDSFKDFYVIKPEKSKEINTYIKKNKLKKKNEDDLIKLFNYIIEP